MKQSEEDEFVTEAQKTYENCYSAMIKARNCLKNKKNTTNCYIEFVENSTSFSMDYLKKYNEYLHIVYYNYWNKLYCFYKELDQSIVNIFPKLECM